MSHDNQLNEADMEKVLMTKEFARENLNLIVHNIPMERKNEKDEGSLKFTDLIKVDLYIRELREKGIVEVDFQEISEKIKDDEILEKFSKRAGV